MSGALHGLVVIVGGTTAQITSATIGTTINVASNPTAVQVTVEIIGVAGVGGAAIKSVILSLERVYDGKAATTNPTVGEIIDIAAAVALAFPGTQPLGVALTFGSLAWSAYEFEQRQIEERVNSAFQFSKTGASRDPLAIDLDGDGIETVGIPASGNPILFDHDANGVRTGTGWLKGDDGWLVRDLNGNGSIDSGRELFGVDTRIVSTDWISSGLSVTQERNAYSGFDALRVLDSDGNGTINANDLAWSELSVWRDLNQDGISQAGELQSLSSIGIASISLESSPSNLNLGNGNSVTGTATVTRTNGSETEVAGVGLNTAGNLNLADNPFYRTFTDSIALTEQARNLPEMTGAGWTRDLREAMSLPDGGELAGLVQQFANADNRTAQLALIDQLLTAWADSTGRLATAAGQEVVRGVTVNETTSSLTVRYTVADPTPDGGITGSGIELVQYNFADPAYMAKAIGVQGFSYSYINSEGLDWLARRNVLEVFNGQRFFTFESTSSKNAGGGSGSGSGGGGGGVVVSDAPQVRWTYTFNNQQVALIDQAYEALRESVYQALALQTRLASYLNVIELSIDENGIHFDTAPMAQMLAAKHSTNLQTGIEDLAELVRYAQPTLAAVGYDGLGTLRQWVEALPPSSPLLAQLQADGLFTYGAGLQASSGTDVFLGNASANQVNGGAGNDVLDGGAGNDYLYGGDGDDVVRGGADSDTLYGDNGNDTLDGGAGNDTLYGGIGSDTYLFGRGSGADMVSDVDSTAGNTDVLSIGSGVTADQLWFRRVGADLEVSIIGAGDKTTISGWYSGSAYHVEQFKTADGQLLLDTQVDALVAAMASFAPPAAGQTVLPADYQTALNPVIAANWK